MPTQPRTEPSASRNGLARTQVSRHSPLTACQTRNCVSTLPPCSTAARHIRGPFDGQRGCAGQDVAELGRHGGQVLRDQYRRGQLGAQPSEDDLQRFHSTERRTDHHYLIAGLSTHDIQSARQVSLPPIPLVGIL